MIFHSVLTDITEVLFNDELLDELSAVQSLESHNNVRTLLVDIASVSIMRLDPVSMNKLWELMTMMLKWQISLIRPHELAELTRRHLQGVRDLPLQQAITKMDRALQRFDGIFQHMTAQELSFTRNALLFWLGDFRIKVSILLKLGLQRNDGSFVLSENIISKYVHNLGKNIYLLNNNASCGCKNIGEAVEPQKIDSATNTDSDISELSFVRNLVENAGGETKKIKFNLKLISIEKKINNDAYQIENESAGDQISYIQSQPSQSSVKNEHIATSENTTTNIGKCPNEASSIHEDLLSMLDEELSLQVNLKIHYNLKFSEKLPYKMKFGEFLLFNIFCGVQP